MLANIPDGNLRIKGEKGALFSIYVVYNGCTGRRMKQGWTSKLWYPNRV